MSEPAPQMGQTVDGRRQIIRSTNDFTPQALGELVDYMSVNQPRISITSLAGFKFLKTSGTWDPASIAAGASTTVAVTLQGATPGDFVLVGMSPALATGLVLHAAVTAQDTVTAQIYNSTAGAVDPVSSTLNVAIIR